MAAIPTSTNFKLNLPPFDTRAYDSLVNDNFKAIDALIQTYLTLSNVQGVWTNSTRYTVGDKVIDGDAGQVFECAVTHISAASPITFAETRTANPTYWTAPSIPARGLGVWVSGHLYEPGDFVIASSVYYAVCISTHTSGATFLGDSAHWDVLIDLNGIGLIPSTVGHGSQYARVKADASGLEYVPITTVSSDLGLGTLAFQNGILGTLGTQDATAVTISGGAISGVTLTGVTLSSVTSQAGARAALNLGTAATLNVGTTALRIVQLDAAAKLPAVDGSQLTNLNIPSPTGSNIALWAWFT